MPQPWMTIERHIVESQRMYNPQATGELSKILMDIAFCCKVINKDTNKAGLADILGKANRENVQGEEQQKLDVWANELMKNVLSRSGLIAAMSSEEEEKAILVPSENTYGRYVISFDPLDGSSNIDANVSIGTIFAIHRRRLGQPAESELLQPGRHLVAAGYVIYGSSSIFVYSTGHGVHGFTLHPAIGDFLLSHPDIRTPERAKIYSTNEGHSDAFPEGVKKFIQYVKTPNKKEKLPMSARYIGSMVADIHRNLLYGGVFMYPPTEKSPNGKLRLLYEASPLAFIVEQAGGYASNGEIPILDIKPESLHQRVPLYIGSTYDVKMLEDFIQGRRDL